MKQEKLIQAIKNKNIDDIKPFEGPAKFFKTSKKYYSDIQDGIASKRNFFENTLVIYDEVKKPKGKPDFDSDSGSRYWYFKDGVIRQSDHWGNGVANCDWAYRNSKGKITYGTSYKSCKSFKKPIYGFARWDAFLFKARLIEINGKQVVTTFKNCYGRDLIKVDGKKYQRVIIESFEEVK